MEWLEVRFEFFVLSFEIIARVDYLVEDSELECYVFSNLLPFFLLYPFAYHAYFWLKFVLQLNLSLSPLENRLD